LKSACCTDGRAERGAPTRVVHEAHLALLELDEPAALDGIAPLEFGDLPAVRDAVAAYGFPHGGETPSITEGAVARVEHELYVQSRSRAVATGREVLARYEVAADPSPRLGRSLRRER
jgi:Trypsin-like peptidase domain